jgi:hypothetical protein
VVHDCKRIVIPPGARNATLQVLHRSHAEVTKTAEAAKQLYFWPKMNEHIKDMIDACEVSVLQVLEAKARADPTNSIQGPVPNGRGQR